MPRDVSPGEPVTVDAKIAALDPAKYTLAWTVTEYGSRVFTSVGVPSLAMTFSSVNIPPQLTAESPGSGAVFDSLTPALWANGTDVDRYPNGTLQFAFEVCEVEGKNARRNYSGTRTVPYEFQMSCTAWDGRGRYADADATTVSNLIYAAGRGWKNLGTAIDSRTGADVPLPGQP